MRATAWTSSRPAWASRALGWGRTTPPGLSPGHPWPRRTWRASPRRWQGRCAGQGGAACRGHRWSRFGQLCRCGSQRAKSLGPSARGHFLAPGAPCAPWPPGPRPGGAHRARLLPRGDILGALRLRARRLPRDARGWRGHECGPRRFAVDTERSRTGSVPLAALRRLARRDGLLQLRLRLLRLRLRHPQPRRFGTRDNSR
mmetsp:Transcript_17215/g.49994  ORF Transcript_17215/g.49994 Transcript_17215/m.49994 type:complete len:200 (-) Transcript_17215:201-800(-)